MKRIFIRVDHFAFSHATSNEKKGIVKVSEPEYCWGKIMLWGDEYKLYGTLIFHYILKVELKI